MSKREQQKSKLIQKQLKEDIKQLSTENIQLAQQVLELNLACVVSRLFLNVRSSKEQKSRRNRQCLICGSKILKGEKYINHQVRYDKTILTIYLHKACSNGL